MRIAHATHSLDGSTGVQTYMVTVADEMQRTGHDVWLCANVLGTAAEYAESLGLRVVGDADQLPEELDFVIPHSALASHDLAAARPGVPQVFVAHGSYFDAFTPPQIDGAVACVVTLWGQAAVRMAALATNVPVVTLSQPVDRSRFRERAPIAPKARRALILSNYLDGERRERLEQACELAGVEWEHVGATGAGESTRAEDAINRADFVIGKGRVAVEAMACGRAVYLYDMWGSDGWLTPETYDEYSFAGFGGTVTTQDPGVDQLAADFGAYSERLGAWGSQMTVLHHRLDEHVGKLIELGVAAAGNGARTGGSRGDSEELVRLARQSSRHEAQAHVLGEHLKQQSQKIAALERELDASRREAQELVRELDTIRGSNSWRLTAPLRRMRSSDR
ncbi:MAG: glycosyltransferase [Solirubrobacterales bacterium]